MPDAVLHIVGGEHHQGLLQEPSVPVEDAGRPDLETFTIDCQLVGSGAIDLRGLSPQLMLEFQYALQRRHDERTRTATPKFVAEAVHRARAAGVSSLLDRSAQEWRRMFRSRVRAGGVFLLDAGEAVEALRDGTGWEVEYPRDVWRLHLLPGVELGPGRPTERVHLRFDRITQPWLRELGKRWLRLRLSSGLSATTAKAVSTRSPASASSSPESASTPWPRSTDRCWNAIWPG